VPTGGWHRLHGWEVTGPGWAAIWSMLVDICHRDQKHRSADTAIVIAPRPV
jgi:hypothetical protein